MPPWSQTLKAGPCSVQGADYTTACLQRGCLAPASAFNAPLHVESDLISPGLASNPFMPLHPHLLPIALWGAGGCIIQEGRGAGWASGVWYEPDYSSRGAISFPRLAQNHPAVKVLSQKVAMKDPNLQLQHPLSTALAAGPQALGCGCSVPSASLMRGSVALGSCI